MMTLLEAIDARHSVRRYISRPLEREVVDCLRAKIDECNSNGNLHIQLVLNERKGFSGMLAYGSFSGVENYIVRVGYYGEQIVLLAQQLGLGTCWAGLSYRKVKGAYALDSEEKVACMISLGYPDDAGRKHKCKSVEDVSNACVSTPEWFEKGVRAALKAPTAVNQQKFYIEYAGVKDGRHCVRARRLFSVVGYTSMDLGIVKLHFEIGAGKDNFEWV